MKLPILEHRCLAYDIPHPSRKKLPEWCALSNTCERHLALRTDGANPSGRIIEYRVCKVGETDAYIESQP